MTQFPNYNKNKNIEHEILSLDILKIDFLRKNIIKIDNVTKNRYIFKK